MDYLPVSAETDIVDIADTSAGLAMACAGEVTTCEAWLRNRSLSPVTMP